ncbi:sodium/proton antiporter 1 [Ziziphus jujuba]|uniref:Sodium/proton antiporter 1 n=1 Tax=Ziziphus jujuba TaxID=326968 RepID=A0ABM3IPR1_ZIZJJ|nr:sodium/proton antiporter 1 [Ziziphus jujuba]
MVRNITQADASMKAGIRALIFVLVFKALTGLLPFMGILLGLGVLLILTDAIHYGESETQKLKVSQVLESVGILRELANYLNAHILNVQLIASVIGVVLAVIDNVSLVATTVGMYDLTSFPIDSEFWLLIAFCAGTSRSMLVNGSAAGVAYVGMEKVDFFWLCW